MTKEEMERKIKSLESDAIIFYAMVTFVIVVHSILFYMIDKNIGTIVDILSKIVYNG